MRPQTHLMALLTILPKFDLSSAMGISSGFISVLIAFNDLYLMLNTNILLPDLTLTRALISSEMLKWNLGEYFHQKAHWVTLTRLKAQSYNLLNPISRGAVLASPSNINKRLYRYHLTLNMTINIKKLLALRNQVWHWEPGPALHSVQKIYLSRSSIQTTNYLSYLLSIIDCIRKDCALCCLYWERRQVTSVEEKNYHAPCQELN